MPGVGKQSQGPRPECAHDFCDQNSSGENDDRYQAEASRRTVLAMTALVAMVVLVVLAAVVVLVAVAVACDRVHRRHRVTPSSRLLRFRCGQCLGHR